MGKPAVRLLAASEESVSQVARSLGIHDNLLRRWRQQLGDGTDIKMSESGLQERSELIRLRRRCRDLERELVVLKKTLGLSPSRKHRDTK
jgi:transposase-like protein